MNDPRKSGEILNYLMEQCPAPDLNFDALADTMQMLIGPAIRSRADSQAACNHIMNRFKLLCDVANEVITEVNKNKL